MDIYVCCCQRHDLQTTDDEWSGEIAVAIAVMEQEEIATTIYLDTWRNVFFISFFKLRY